jgi:class 3 adenylate cyclase
MAAEGTEKRRLAAIMFTDIVGYTAMTQRNEALTLEILHEHRRLLRELFPKFDGREIETTGDGFLVEFESAVEAVRCAIEIQRTLATRNLSVTSERRVELRIGVHVGDVVHKEGTFWAMG